MLPFLAPTGMMAGVGFDVTQTSVREHTSGMNPTYTGVPFGPPSAARHIAVMAWHRDIGVNPGFTPTCQIAGGAATRIRAESTGTGNGPAVGVALFTRALAAGESGTVEISWGAAPMAGIVVLRTVGYDLSAAHDVASSGPAQNIAVPAGGLILAAAGRRLPYLSPMGFTGVPRPGSDIVAVRRNWGWDHRLRADSSYPVAVTTWDATHGYMRWLMASFPRLS